MRKQFKAQLPTVFADQHSLNGPVLCGGGTTLLSYSWTFTRDRCLQPDQMGCAILLSVGFLLLKAVNENFLRAPNN